MNIYGNKIGCHSPKETKRVLEEINNKCKLKFIDNSWHNNEVDSLFCEMVEDKFIELYLKSDFYKTYFLTNEENDELLITGNLEKIINYINKL